MATISQDKDISCVTVQGALSYFIDSFGMEKLSALLEELDLTYEFVSDRENWLPWSDYTKLVEAITNYGGSPDEAMEEISRRSLDKKLIGNVWYLLFSNFISFKTTLANAVKYRQLYNRTADWEVIELTDNKFVVNIKWRDGKVTTRCACLHRRSVISKAPLLWGEEPATVREIQCQLDGHDSCIDEYRWSNKSRRVTTYVLASVTFFALLYFDTLTADKAYFSFSLMIIAILLGLLIDGKRKVKIHGDNNQNHLEQLCSSMDKLEEKYDELHSVNAELNKAYDELYESRKLQPLGVLAGSIAHDYNNILTGIMGYLQFLKISVEAGEDKEKILHDIEDLNQAAEQARNLTNRLLVFSKHGAPIVQVLSIDELLKENVRFALTGSNIECRFDIDKDIWRVDVDKYQFGQVITNIAINAVQAMPQGGHLYVSACNQQISGFDKDVRFPIQSGPYVVIRLVDEGVGISKEHLGKIFDPYFTTKKSGSGLGLASSYNIIKKHRGYIRVESTLGKGSEFLIYVPKSDKKISASPIASGERPVFGRGRVLVLDDDPTIRKILNAILKYLGYQVDVTQNGSDTITRYEEALTSSVPYDAVILDLTVCGTVGGGQAVMKSLLAIDPHVKGIVSSGYSNETVIANFREYGFMAAIRKPYTLTELSNIVYDVVSEQN